MGETESNIPSVTKVYNVPYERTTAHEQDKVSLHPNSSEIRWLIWVRK